MRLLQAGIAFCLVVSNLTTLTAQVLGGHHDREDVRSAEAVQVLDQLISAINPAKTPLPSGLIVKASESRSGLSDKAFSQAITSAQVFVDDREATDPAPVLTPLQQLERHPLLPLYLLEAAEADQRTGLSLQQSGSQGGRLILYLHTPYWRAGMQAVGTVRVGITFDPQTFLIKCEQEQLHFGHDYLNTSVRSTCFSGYRPTNGLNFPYTLTQALNGSTERTITIQSISTN